MFRILVVDDEPEMVLAISSRLKATKDFKVESAADGLEAVSKALNNEYDCIILDIMMPGLTGLEVCSKLRDNDKTVNTPIIITTCYSDEESVKEAISCGASDYIKKPFYGMVLIDKARKWAAKSVENRTRNELTVPRQINLDIWGS